MLIMFSQLYLGFNFIFYRLYRLGISYQGPNFSTEGWKWDSNFISYTFQGGGLVWNSNRHTRHFTKACGSIRFKARYMSC